MNVHFSKILYAALTVSLISMLSFSCGAALTVSLISMLSFSCGGVKTFPLAENGKTEYAIVLSSKASPSEKRAAEELSFFLSKASGAEFAIVNETEKRANEPNRIYVGFGDAAQKLASQVKPVDMNKLKDEGFIIRTVPHDGAKPDIILAGARRRGTMYAVYSFLDELGFRWYTNRTTWYPDDKNLTVSEIDDEVIPYFMFREPYIYEAWNPDWAARNRVNLGHSFSLDDAHGGSVRMLGGHTFGHLIPNSLFKEHPDYFPLIGGKRVTGYVQRCLSNQGTVEVAAENMIKWMDENPEAKIFSLAQEDTEKLCECPDCVRKTEEEGAPSGLYLDFVNKTAEIVEKNHPDKYIITFAYWFTEKPPKTVKPRHNVIIRLCPISICVAHPFTECMEKPSVSFRDHLKGWSKLSDFTFIWHYNTNFHNLHMPFPNFKEFAPDIRNYYEHGVKGIFFQGSSFGPGGAESDMRAWVMARLLWDPYQDPDEVVNEYMHGVYGKAFKPMREYYDLIHSRIADPEMHLHIFEPVSDEKWPADVVEKMDALHEEALALAEGDTTAAYYIKKNRMSVKYIQYVLGTGLLQADNGQYAPEGNTMTPEDFDSFIDYTKQFGVRELREPGSDYQFKNILRQRAETHKTVSIENEDIRIVAVPELGGRIVSILHKESGTDIINNLSPMMDSRYPADGGYDESTTRTWGCAGFANSYKAAVNGRTITLTSQDVGKYTGRTPAGLVFERKISLPAQGSKIMISSSISNTGEKTSAYQLVCRMHLNTDHNKTSTLARDNTGGFKTPTPTEVKTSDFHGEYEHYRYDGDNLPAGAWKLENITDGMSVINSFNTEQVSTCQVTINEDMQVARMEIHTPVTEVPPGGMIVIDHQWEITK